MVGHGSQYPHFVWNYFDISRHEGRLFSIQPLLLFGNCTPDKWNSRSNAIESLHEPRVLGGNNFYQKEKKHFLYLNA